MPLKIDSYKSCPHCGGDNGYYLQYKVSGIVDDNTTFTGEKENSGMNDSIIYKRIGDYYKCRDCGKDICKVDSEVVKRRKIQDCRFWSPRGKKTHYCSVDKNLPGTQCYGVCKLFVNRTSSNED